MIYIQRHFHNFVTWPKINNDIDTKRWPNDKGNGSYEDSLLAIVL